jgi:CheY-like chemotaxis protein
MGNGAKKRILLVEDHDDTLRATSRLLRLSGYDVEAVGTKAEALAICGTKAFDLLLSDLSLSDGSGVDVMREVSAKHGLKGVAYTGMAHGADSAVVMAAGFSAYLLKPIKHDELVATIERVIAA